jgi:large subunit ribosomal protein L13
VRLRRSRGWSIPENLDVLQDPGFHKFCANSRVQHPKAAEEFNFRGWALRGQFLGPPHWKRQGRERRSEMSTYIPSGLNIDRKWFVVDASDKTLGRLATEAASVLSGKRNPKYTPFLDMGDHVIVINASKVRLTGLKSQSKVYRRYTGFPGGLREESFTRLMQRRPEKVIEEAIKGMLPKTKLGRKMATKLNVYRDEKHPHAAQKPQSLELTDKK